MSTDPDFLQSEEKNSYAAVFLLATALLLACTVWALWQDSFSRHLWKKFKADFYRLAISASETDLDDEEKRLREIPEYVELGTQLEEVQSTLSGSGEEGRKLKQLAEQLDAVEIAVMETDFALRIVKGEIEEAWYRLEFAEHAGESGDAEHRVLDERMAAKERGQVAYDDALANRDSAASDHRVLSVECPGSALS